MFERKFASASESAKRKLAFIDEFSSRKFGDSALVICGEANIIQTTRSSARIKDEYGFRRQIAREGIRTFLNPWHTYSRRYECNVKRQALSREAALYFQFGIRGAPMVERQRCHGQLIAMESALSIRWLRSVRPAACARISGSASSKCSEPKPPLLPRGESTAQPWNNNIF